MLHIPQVPEFHKEAGNLVYQNGNDFISKILYVQKQLKVGSGVLLKKVAGVGEASKQWPEVQEQWIIKMSAKPDVT